MTTTTVVSINGIGKSGTTLIGAALANSTDMFYAGEMHAAFRPTRVHHFDPECTCGQRPCPIWSQVLGHHPRTAYRRLADASRLSGVVDSSKPLSWVWDISRWSESKSTRVVHLVAWKYPVDFAYSAWQRGSHLDAWRPRFITYYRRLLGLGLEARTMNYRSFVDDAASMITAVGTWADRAITDLSLDHWNRQPHFLFGTGSMRSLARTGRFDITNVEPPDEFLSEWERVARSITAEPVASLVHRLEAMDVRDGAPMPVRPAPLSRPPWYWKERAVSYGRRLRPRQWVRRTRS